ncbi:MAG TPA: cation:proton antiporter [Campylobacterales bacterium]|nr:cation:proton antiporter [Campylobacterales bacterium]HHD80415.1 cation:proton antiporter [Campylobacterales bacterium]
MQTLFFVGLIMVLGSFMKFISHRAKILNVVGYLILGLIIGPEVLNIVPQHFIDETHIITDLSLSIISVLVGANLRYNILKEVWKQIVIISIFEAIFTFVFISSIFYLLFDFLEFGFVHNYRLIISVIFGGLASATAPATILAVIHELKVKGKFSSFLLGVVATDNAIALILFSFILIITSSIMYSGSCAYSTVFMIIPTIFLTIGVGVMGAMISEIIDRIFKPQSNIKTTSTLGMIFLVYSLSQHWGLEPLLASLVMGIVMSNLSDEFYLVKKEFDYHLKDIIFLLFFTISSMHLNVSFLLSMPFIIILYITFRILGKILGVWTGGKVSGADKHLQKYLGIALFPQAGIAIGLSLSLQNEAGFEVIAPIILNVIIATTLVHELIGPMLTKYVLKKSCECNIDK